MEVLSKRTEKKSEIKEKEITEGISSIKKIIGGTKGEREKVRIEMAKRFAKQEEIRQELEKKGVKEIEKTAEQIRVIDIFNEQINGLQKKYKLPEISVDKRNVHILKKEDYDSIFREKDEEKTLAKFSRDYQAIFVRETDSILRFATRYFHDLIELNLYQKIKITEDEQYKTEQAGIYIIKDQKEYFKNLKEGIVEELTKIKFYEKALENPYLPKALLQEMEFTQERKVGLLSSKEELFSFLQKTTQNQSLEFKSRLVELKESEKIELAKILVRDIYSAQIPSVFPLEKKEPTYELFSYPQERKIFNTLVRKLYAKNPGQFKKEDEARELFFQSIFTGEFEWKEPLEKTFGEGTFDKLGEKDKNPEELGKFVNEL